MMGELFRRLFGSAPTVRLEDVQDDDRWALFLSECDNPSNRYRADPTKLESAGPLLSGNAAHKLHVLLTGLAKLAAKSPAVPGGASSENNISAWVVRYAVRSIVFRLLRSELPFDEKAFTSFLRLTLAADSRQSLPWAAVVRAIERFAGGDARVVLTVEQSMLLYELRQRLDRSPATEIRRLAQRIDALICEPSGSEAQPWPIEAGEVWADSALDTFKSLESGQAQQWRDLLGHALTARGSSPSVKWLKKGRASIDGIGQGEVVRQLGTWLPLVGKPGRGRPMRGFVHPTFDPTVVSDQNADVLKGLAWMASTLGEAPIAAILGDLAEVCYKKIPVHGARCPKVANAAVVALSLMNSPAAIAQLSRLKGKVKKASARKIVEKALAKVAEVTQLTVTELEEMSVPDLGFDTAGKQSIALGNASAELEVSSPSTVHLRWRSASGKLQASVPAEQKLKYPKEVQAIRRLVKDAQGLVASRAAYLERLLLNDPTWPTSVWRQRYLDHPIVSQIARKLIWKLDTAEPASFICDGSGFTDSMGNAFALDSSATVKLWHPIDATIESVQKWRAYLMRNDVRQPFKQAHREVYLLTDAERATETYSNRFAAHLLRQHQFQALCDARGWTYKLMGAFDSHNVPTRKVEQHNLCVEFWVEGGGSETSPNGIYLHVSTDQVRFTRQNQPIPLHEVPARVFSELMRDVDLFVGVASVGNDPTWQDRGAERGLQAYWQNFSFGDLSETAKTRRQVLESLLPRLTKIRDRCTLEEKFLVVRGSLRTYKIHLGSGNILMEPNDQYLCIVPNRSAQSLAESVFLPFEGDSTLSIILSKAFLLAEDRKITDRTITQQIKR